jgi:hypothetical protein
LQGFNLSFGIYLLPEFSHSHSPQNAAIKLLLCGGAGECQAPVLGYLQKLIKFLYTTENDLTKKEIKKSSPFTTSSKRKRYIVINFTREVKDL